MSDAATPETAPAGGGVDAAVDSAMSLLGGDGADEPAARPEDDGQATAAADADADPSPGDEAEATDPEQQSEDNGPEPTVRVKVRGEWREVPLSEAAAGYSRTEDYKAKTAELAEHRRAVEQAAQALHTRAQQLDALLSMAPLDPVLAEGAQTDWAQLAQEDPAGYVARKEAYAQRLQAFQRIAAERQRMAQEQHHQAIARGDAELRQHLPDWSDDAKRTDLQRRMSSLATQTYGFAPQEVAGLADPRMVRVLHDAMAWREHQAQRQAADAKRVAPAPNRVIRPGAAAERGAVPSERARALATRARQTGRVDDAVDAVLARLG